MSLGRLGFLAGALGSAALVYGALYETKRLTLERHRLHLPLWPERLAGFRLGVLADFHLRDRYSQELAQRAISMLLDENPDMVAIVGDFVGYWKGITPKMLGQTLEPLLLMNGNVVAVPGNHEYYAGHGGLLKPICDELNIKLLRNESWRHQGITWVGVDSYNARRSDVRKAFLHAEQEPKLVLWHEPDLVHQLPKGVALQLSGHSHGGQFRFPGGFTPMHSRNGEKYVRGFYPEAPTPIYVTRGVGTTGPPSRFLCPPEVAILSLYPG